MWETWPCCRSCNMFLFICIADFTGQMLLSRFCDQSKKVSLNLFRRCVFLLARPFISRCQDTCELTCYRTKQHKYHYTVCNIAFLFLDWLPLSAFTHEPLLEIPSTNRCLFSLWSVTFCFSQPVCICLCCGPLNIHRSTLPVRVTPPPTRSLLPTQGFSTSASLSTSSKGKRKAQFWMPWNDAS